MIQTQNYRMKMLFKWMKRMKQRGKINFRPNLKSFKQRIKRVNFTNAINYRSKNLQTTLQLKITTLDSFLNPLQNLQIIQALKNN